MSVLSEINPDVRRIKISEHDILDERAEQIRTEIRQGLVKRYKDVIDVSSGNPHGMGLKPLTFVRQVLATCFYPSLVHDESLPLDVRQRAQSLLAECDGESIGSYPATYGMKHVRSSVSTFITRRDGVVSDPDNIIISNGSQHALILILKLLVQGRGLQQTGVLTPVPCYRSFNKALVAQGAVSVPYYLCEEQGWTVQVEELRRALQAARGHCNPMVLYLINPGNPSGHVQSKASIEEVIRFAAEERLFIMADEVYQGCVFGKDSEFYSYKKVLSEMGPPYSTNVELASFHSVSKGFMGECGLRCGYVEMVNLDPQVMRYAYQAFSINALASVPGQITLDVMLNPPEPGDPSYAVYAQEVKSVMSAIKNNAQRIMDVVSGLPGMTCQPINGGIFMFLRLHLSKAAIEHAEEKDLEPDLLYSMRLLEDTGLCVAPGCELRQKQGTHHIRICLATPEEIMEDVLHRLKSFHLRFIKEFP
ncbi:alanine aminotransferase 2-like isoform X1 [Astyanax mexicanus]|uniref:alanine transaminase n=1 Tax=Astyanax mexicanus TaxID=7994 RepID=A0A8T2LRU6_ASTMX|nr:alanine aminotransferase 2-like isoform X1 [Astyanax mexicanus]